MSPPAPSILQQSDPLPVEIRHPEADVGLVLTCEHAGRALPTRLATRAPSEADMARHIAWDLGSGAVARGLAERLGAPLVLQRYSRLVIDCNRPRDAPDLVPAVSDGTEIAFNRGISAADIDARWHAIHQPFHQAVARLLDARGPAALVAIHSFTPRMRGGVARPVAVGLLARTDLRLALALEAALTERVPGLPVALNAPYRIEDDSDYTIPTHAEARGLPHLLLEIRNDLIVETEGIARWSALLAEVLPAALAALRGEIAPHGL